MTSKKVFHCTAITAVILLATSNVVFAEDYQLPATVNNPVVLPVGADVDVHTIGAKSIAEVIYCFEKFTIGKDKVLLAEVLEQGGDRNIGLRIPETFIIEARKL